MDVAYLKFSNNLLIISNQLRKEIIIPRFCAFQSEVSLNAATTSNNRLMPKSWLSRRASNKEEGTEVNRSYYFHQKIMQRTVFVAYCSNSATQSYFVTSAGFYKEKKKR